MLLLLLARGRAAIGRRSTIPARDHVLMLDTSAWMGARARQGTLIDEAKAAARAFIKALPPRDRVMLVRADALATPVTAFESNRQALEDAIRRSQPGASALNLEQAFEFAAAGAEAAIAAAPARSCSWARAACPEEEAATAGCPRICACCR